MTDIMKQRGDPQEFFNIMDGGDLLKLRREKRIEMTGKSACHVHRTYRMDKAAMLRGWIDPSCALELENIAKALHPWRIDQIFFSSLGRVWRRIGDGEGNIFVNRIGNQRRSIIESLRGKREGFHVGPGWFDVSILLQLHQVGNRSSTEDCCARYREMSQ
jgi:hypothetical protein